MTVRKSNTLRTRLIVLGAACAGSTSKQMIGLTSDLPLSYLRACVSPGVLPSYPPCHRRPRRPSQERRPSP
jgi:hypothetical protein